MKRQQQIKNTKSPELSLQEIGVESVYFPKGLIGFQECKSFSIQYYGDNQYLMLTSDDDPDVRFLVCNLPWDFYPSKDLVEGLINENLDEIDEEIYAIVCCSKDVPTVNLRAPLVRQDHKMWQVVLGSHYPLDYALD